MRAVTDLFMKSEEKLPDAGYELQMLRGSRIRLLASGLVWTALEGHTRPTDRRDRRVLDVKSATTGWASLSEGAIGYGGSAGIGVRMERYPSEGDLREFSEFTSHFTVH